MMRASARTSRAVISRSPACRREVACDGTSIRPLRLLPVACLLASTWATPSSLAASIADDPVDERAYQVRENCISRRDLRRIEPLDDRHLLFRMRNGEMLLNVTLQICDGLERDLAIEIRSWDGRQFCRLDDVSVPSNFIRSTCELSWFEPVTEAQLEVVREAIAAKARDRQVPKVGTVRAPDPPATATANQP